MSAPPRFSKDAIPPTDPKANPGKVVQQVDATHPPALLTHRDHSVTIVQAPDDYEAADDERSFQKAVVRGLLDLEEGREFELQDVKQRVGLG